MEACPVCNKLKPLSRLEAHVNDCLEGIRSEEEDVQVIEPLPQAAPVSATLNTPQYIDVMLNNDTDMNVACCTRCTCCTSRSFGF